MRERVCSNSRAWRSHRGIKGRASAGRSSSMWHAPMRGRYHALLVGTGDSPLTVPFYECCGFTRSHVVPNFFTEYYDHPIYEAGVLLRDMVYLKRPLA